MSKIIDYEQGVWKKTIINPDETIERSKDVVSYASDKLEEFNEDSRIITSMTITVNYCNTEETNSNIPANWISSKLDEVLLTLEESSIHLKENYIEYAETNSTIHDKIIRYLDVIVSRGMMNEHQYARFYDVMNKVYALLTGNRRGEFDIPNIIDYMNLDYELKCLPPTVACPDTFFKLIKKSVKATEISDSVNGSDRDKLDQFMKKWFNQGGKIYDKDRDEFYMEFMTVYESITNSSTNNSDDDGSITVRRRSKQKQVMGMKQILNYVEINKILEKYGLNYHIIYQQEPGPAEDRGKRRNSLSLKDNRY